MAVSMRHLQDVFKKAAVAEGQALIEYALIVPLLFLLILNAANFGGFIYDWITVANATRAASQYAVLAGASINSPTQATAAQIKALISSETSTMPGGSGSNPSVSVCENNNGTITTITGSCANPPAADPEAPLYVTLSVDLTYTYTPFISAFNFPNLGIGMPAMPPTIHRRTIMRMLQ
jgi:Flp pilus assembly protein TadG